MESGSLNKLNEAIEHLEAALAAIDREVLALPLTIATSAAHHEIGQSHHLLTYIRVASRHIKACLTP